MYCLDLIESIVESPIMPANPDSDEAKLRKDWIERFLKIGGFNQLLLLLEKAHQLSKATIDREDASNEKNNIIKQFLKQMLKIIKIFITAAIQANHSAEQAETIHLLRKHSSIREGKQDQSEEVATKVSEEFDSKPSTSTGT